MLDFGSEHTMLCFSFFFLSLSLLLCITSRHFVSGCGPVTCLASCSANMQHSFVALCFFFFPHLCVCVICFQESDTRCCCLINFTAFAVTLPNHKDFLSLAHRRRSGGLGHAALISPSHMLRHCLTKWSPLSALLFKRGGEKSCSLNESAEWKAPNVNQRYLTPHRNSEGAVSRLPVYSKEYLNDQKGFMEVKLQSTPSVESLNLCCSQQPV